MTFASFPPNQPGYTGYVPSDLLAEYKPALYDSLGKPHPFHYISIAGTTYKVSYDDPYTLIGAGASVIIPTPETDLIGIPNPGVIPDTGSDNGAAPSYPTPTPVTVPTPTVTTSGQAPLPSSPSPSSDSFGEGLALALIAVAAILMGRRRGR